MNLPSPRRSAKRVAKILLVALTASTLGVVTAVTAPAASAGTSEPTSNAAEVATTMTFDGRGWGHGRGLSQWGAQGYATKHGWDASRILDHYYGGTRAGQISSATGVPIDPSAVRIRLVYQDNRQTVVGITGGTLALSGLGSLTDPGGLTHVRLTLHEGTLVVEKASSCSGPWSPLGGGTGQSGSSQVTVSRATGSDQLQLCRDDGVTIWYPGRIRAVVEDTGSAKIQRTVNITSIENQLRAVVPRESPASWSAAALQAQSVAARSYAMAGDSRHQPYADTCDTTLCQVYGGFSRRDPGGERRTLTHANTDAAIAATAGVVRINDKGAVARTEFSSTSGGWTAGGTFPAVEDLGDAISPLHTWTRTLAVSSLESSYGKGGRLVEIEVLSRNGLGPDGGRVVKARLRFSNGVTADVSGDTVRSKVQLLSNWFTPTCPLESRYINAVFELFVDRTASPSEIEQWCGVVRRGDRLDLTEALAVTDEWAGVQIAALYGKILGREPEPGGRAYWLEQVASGMLIEKVAALFYGSDEYYHRAGATDRGFVERLYTDLLGRPADDSGTEFWLRSMASGMSRTQVAEHFYASVESRTDRVDALYEQILGRPADRAGRDYWAEQILELGDVALAAYLAASDEYYSRAVESA